MKNHSIKIVLFTIVVAITFSGCLNTSTELSTECAIIYLDVPNQNGYIELEAREFTISDIEDEDGFYLITNEEPLPYGALSDSIYTRYYTENNNLVTHTFQYLDSLDELKDSVIVMVSNSESYKLDYTKDIVFEVFAQDPNYVKRYKIRMTVDEENPEEILWNKMEGSIPFDLNGYYTAYSVGEKVFVLWGQPDETSGVISNELYSSIDGSSWTQHDLTDGTFPEGIYHAIGTYQDEVICFSSLNMNESGEYFADNTVYWKTTDGIHWSSDTIKVNTPDFAFHSLAYLNGTLFAFGGTKVMFGEKEIENALYDNGKVPEGSYHIYSYDESGWSRLNKLLPEEMASRFGGLSAAKGRIYLTNGEIANGTAEQVRDVWATETGDYWLNTGQESTTPLYGSQLTYYNNHLWRIGGYENENNTINLSVLSETIDDGDTWFEVNQETRPYTAPPEDFLSRYNHQSLIDAQKRLWVIGGLFKDLVNDKDTPLNEVWIADARGN